MNKVREFVTDLRDVVPPVDRRSFPKIILGLAVIIVAIVLIAAALRYFFPEGLDRFEGWGYLGVFLITLISSLTIIVPLPGTIVWPGIVLAMDLNPAAAALVASFGGSLGEISAYLAGRWGEDTIEKQYGEKYEAARRWTEHYGGFAIFTFALIPFLLFDLAGLAAGAFRYPVKRFLFFCWLGRLPRSLIECYIYYYTGRSLMEHLFPSL